MQGLTGVGQGKHAATEMSHHLQLQAWTLRQIINNIAETIQDSKGLGNTIMPNAIPLQPVDVQATVEELTGKFFSALDILNSVCVAIPPKCKPGLVFLILLKPS